MNFNKNFYLTFITCLFLSLNSFAEKNQYVCESRKTEHSVIWALDISSSMDIEEYKTQINGYISALNDKAVQSNLFHCQCTEIAIVVWSETQTLKYDFKQMKDEKAVKDLISFLENYQNSYDDNYSLGYTTNVLDALGFSYKQILTRKNTEQTPELSITISGDGFHNRTDPATIEQFRAQKQTIENNGVTVNGVPVLIYEYSDFVPLQKSLGSFQPSFQDPLGQHSGSNSDYKDLADFYDREIVTSDGYVEKAENFEDFGRAVRNSILRDTCKLMM